MSHPAPAAYQPEHVHLTKKVIAARLGTSTRRVTEMMAWAADPLPVVFSRSADHWLIDEAALAAWEKRHQLTAQEAQQLGVIRGQRGKAA